MRSDGIVTGDAAVQKRFDDRQTLMEFRRADDELTFAELLAGKSYAGLSSPDLGFRRPVTG
jgi:hypothetical protein